MFHLSASSASFEYLAVKVTTAGRRLNIAAIYRPPSPSSYDASVGVFCVDLTDFLDELSACSGELLVAGDFSCPGDRGVVDLLLLDVLEARGLVQHVDQPTHKDHVGCRSL
jgi:hypothetical protein